MTMVPARKYPVATGVPNRIVLGEPHVLVLIAGTVDPTNFWEDINLTPEAKKNGQATHGRSYSQPGEKNDPKYWANATRGAPDTHDENWYWETNPKLRDKIEKLRTAIPNLHVFTMHGWTADNNPRNREIAGRYLCDRLCGGGGEKAYYQGWLKRPVSFHLMGHSHGGNVINEFTRRAATSETWPKSWKIRSITYLSTPFFPRLHPIDTGAFHTRCTVINVFNRFDLTQRVVADFNLYQLNGVMTLADLGSVMTKIKEITFDGQQLWALVPSRVQDVDPSWLGVDVRLVMDPKQGASLYKECLRCIDQLDAVFEQVHAIIQRLHDGVVYPLALQFVDKMCAGREVVSAALAQRFHRKIDQLRHGIVLTRRAMQRRMSSGVYPVIGLFDDLYLRDFVEPFVAFLEMDKATFRGPLADLIHDLLREQIVVFENTTHTPEAKLRGTPYASKLRMFEVTKHDEMMNEDAEPYRRNFDPLMDRLEAIEQRFATAQSQKELLDVLFTLAAQKPTIRVFLEKWLTTGQWIERAVHAIEWRSRLQNLLRGAEADRFIALVHRFARAILTYAELLHERDVGELEIPVSVLPKVDRMPVGSIDYFMRVSHSVSRNDLYDDVRAALLEQVAPSRKQAR